MNEPLFLTIDEVLKIHAYQIETYGGDPGVLNLGLLDSALAQPPMTWQYTAANLATLAATYLFHIAQNHAFADGNKRTAAHAAIVFLSMNGMDLEYPVDETEQITVAVASGAADKAEAVRFFETLLAKSG